MSDNADTAFEQEQFKDAMGAIRMLIRQMAAPLLRELMRRRRLGLWSSPRDDQLALTLYAYVNNNFEITPTPQIAREKEEYALEKSRFYSRPKAIKMGEHMLDMADRFDRERLENLLRLYPLNPDGDNDGDAASTT